MCKCNSVFDKDLILKGLKKIFIIIVKKSYKWHDVLPLTGTNWPVFLMFIKKENSK